MRYLRASRIGCANMAVKKSRVYDLSRGVIIFKIIVILAL